MTATTTTWRPRTKRSALLLLVAFANAVLFFRSWTRSSHDGDDGDYRHPESARRMLDNVEPPDQREMWRRGKGERRTSSDPYKRALELNNYRAPRWLNRNERFSARVLNRRERKRLMNTREDIWLRWGPNARGGGGGDDKNNDDADGGEAAGLDDEAARQLLQDDYDEYEPIEVCGRAADIGKAEEDMAARRGRRYAARQCPRMSPDKPIVIINGQDSYGRTGNNLVELLHAVQYARDNDIQLGISVHSWAMDVIQGMWFSARSDDWERELESELCVKIFHDREELRTWEDRNNTKYMESKELFFYGTGRPLREYMAGQERVIRALFRHYNDGEGYDHKGSPVRDMCSGIDALFGKKKRKHAIYSVIHVRSLEGRPGMRLMNRLAQDTGTDPDAALRMEPEYVKSILRHVGMIEYPIVVITDGEDPTVLERLLDDREIGHNVYVIPPAASWLGGDMTAAIMSNVFIGNPVSTFSAFIAKSRLALGFGHNYLFRAKDENGEWRTICGDSCLFDRTFVGPMA
ncbi:hypothetical protein ACHAW5_008213 [Stephanodiscus triporus]|uniref:Uncharacterized protein n=1 Tax=Stephanodiscus triporus TaxID=2934178 RepID=A0ABD3NC65_9STRA